MRVLVHDVTDGTLNLDQRPLNVLRDGTCVRPASNTPPEAVRVRHAPALRVGIRPLGPRTRATLVTTGIMSGVARHRLKTTLPSRIWDRTRAHRCTLRPCSPFAYVVHGVFVGHHAGSGL